MIVHPSDVFVQLPHVIPKVAALNPWPVGGELSVDLPPAHSARQCLLSADDASLLASRATRAPEVVKSGIAPNVT